jgi:hypothetical protein
MEIIISIYLEACEAECVRAWQNFGSHQVEIIFVHANATIQIFFIIILFDEFSVTNM